VNRAFVIIALFFLSPDNCIAQFTPIDTKCIWITRESLYSPTSIDSALTYAADFDFDKVFIQIRGRGDAFYTSRYVVQNKKVMDGFDPLAYAVELGHELELEIHAWMNMYILWSGKSKPESPHHLLLKHPEWTEANSYGKMDWRINATKPPSPQWEGVYLSPMHPEVNPYLAGIVNEVVENYNIDGIHLDYIRYQDDFYGYNPEGRELFKSKFNIDPIDISRGIISTRFGWEQSFVDSIKNSWQQFRQNRITNLIQLVKSDLEKSGKSIALSAAVKPDLTTSVVRWSQNWRSWLEMGLLDFVIPMNYFKEIALYSQCIKQMKDTLSEDVLKKVIMGVATYNQDANSVVDKILLARLNGFNGVCLFSYDSHKNNLDWLMPVINSFQY